MMLTQTALASTPTTAATDFLITIKNHRFTPDQIKVPANQRLKLTIKNEDNTPEEFESKSLNKEKIVQAHSKIIIYVSPLKKGTYQFGGEYHEDTAQGHLIVE